MANKRSYAGSAFEQGAHDASAQIPGRSGHDDGGVVHDSDTRDSAAWMQVGRD
jgi:hypothetical protein